MTGFDNKCVYKENPKYADKYDFWGPFQRKDQKSLYCFIFSKLLCYYFYFSRTDDNKNLLENSYMQLSILI